MSENINKDILSAIVPNEKWTAQIMDCQNRPKGMHVDEWCSSHGITKANYYYRLHRVREACPQAFPQEMTALGIAKVNPKFLQQFRWLMEGLSITPKKAGGPVKPPLYLG